jgi:hypothetical protein
MAGVQSSRGRYRSCSLVSALLKCGEARWSPRRFLGLVRGADTPSSREPQFVLGATMHAQAVNELETGLWQWVGESQVQPSDALGFPPAPPGNRQAAAPKRGVNTGMTHGRN